MASGNQRTGRTGRTAAVIFAVLFLIIAASCSPSVETVMPTSTGKPTSTPAPSGPEPVVYDFEDGTTQGWIPRGEGVTVSVADEAHSGSHSLLTTDRTMDWHGATVDVADIVEPDTIYEIGAWVKLADGEPESRVILTMQRTPAGGDERYEWISPSAEDGVTDAEWVELKGEYSFTGEVDSLMLYVESTDPELVDFYVDDITITYIGSAKQEPGVYDFEDGTTQGWNPRGDSTVSVSTDEAHGGMYSVLVSGRSADWNGVGLDVSSMLRPGKTYTIGAFVRLADGEPDSRVILTMERTPAGGDTKYEWIAPSDQDGVTDSEWVELSGRYTFTDSDNKLLLYFESPDEELVDFYIDDVTISGLGRLEVQTDIPSLAEYYSDYFLLGAALPSEQLDDEDHVTLLTHHFNLITLENEMKPGPIHPKEDEFRWTGPDKAMAFAKENDITVHGHTLLWHQQGADWMFRDEDNKPLKINAESKGLILQRLEDHIRAVVGRYKDDVAIWDVVNEIIDPSQPDCLSRTDWYTYTGSDYIDTAFRVAHEMDPDAALLINDFSTTEPDKRECLFRVTQDLLARGVPVSGVGHQMHINLELPTVEAIEETIVKFSALGIPQHITELDVSLYTRTNESYDIVPEEVMVKQGYRYKEVFEVFKRQAQYIDTVTFWGMADDHTWLKTFPTVRLNLPLPFDEMLQAKYAYWGMVDPSKLPVLIQTLSAPMGTPVIDGKAERLWYVQSWTELKAGETSVGAFQTLWDEDNLYVFVDVQDATKSPEDRIDVFVDQNNGKTDSYEADDLHIACTNGQCEPQDGLELSYSPTADGYALEVAVALDDSGEIGREIGFDVRVTDGAFPDAPVSWNDSSTSQDSSTAKLGVLTMDEAVALTSAMPGVPVIDAEEDAVWATANEISTDVWALGSSGATAKVKTLWDSKHLYVYAVVTDSLLSKASNNAYEQDSIEVFIDQNNAKTRTYQADDAQYRINFDNEQSFNGGAKAELIQSATKIIDGGYIVELAIILDAVPPVEGGRIGFDFQVNNDEDGDGSRDSIAKWHDPTNESYQNTSGFGLLEFVKPD